MLDPYRCDSSRNENMTYTSKQQIMNSDGLCADAECLNCSCPTVLFKTCDGSASQSFSHDPKTGSFANLAHSQCCLDHWEAGSAKNVGLYTCNGGSNQNWSTKRSGDTSFIIDGTGVSFSVISFLENDLLYSTSRYCSPYSHACLIQVPPIVMVGFALWWSTLTYHR